MDPIPPTKTPILPIKEPILHSAAHTVGLTRGLLRSSEFAHPADGVALVAGDMSDLARVCQALSLVLPDDAIFTHLTSARLRNWWLSSISDEPIIACTNGDAPHHNRRGVYVRRCEVPLAHRVHFQGLHVASAEWTIVELAEHLSLIDLVAVIDCALGRNETTIERIQQTMRKGRRGVRVLRRALRLADGRSGSPWESVLRVAHDLSGIPVIPQYQLRDDAGEILWSLDLLIKGTTRAVEFDGGVHRTVEVHQRDMRRDRILARDGIERFAYGANDLREDPEQVIRDGERALGLPTTPGRAKWWVDEFEKSSFMPRGYGALLHRLKRFARPTSPRATLTSSSGAKRTPSGAVWSEFRSEINQSAPLGG